MNFLHCKMMSSKAYLPHWKKLLWERQPMFYSRVCHGFKLTDWDFWVTFDHFEKQPSFFVASGAVEKIGSSREPRYLNKVEPSKVCYEITFTTKMSRCSVENWFFSDFLLASLAFPISLSLPTVIGWWERGNEEEAQDGGVYPRVSHRRKVEISEGERREREQSHFAAVHWRPPHSTTTTKLAARREY